MDESRPARQMSGNAVPTVFPPTFSGGVSQAKSGHLPIPEPYRDAQAVGPLAAKRRSQSLIKMDRSGVTHLSHVVCRSPFSSIQLHVKSLFMLPCLMKYAGAYL